MQPNSPPASSPAPCACPSKRRRCACSSASCCWTSLTPSGRPPAQHGHVARGIYLRGYAQKDPKLEYKREGFGLFAGDVQLDEEQARTDLQGGKSARRSSNRKWRACGTRKKPRRLTKKPAARSPARWRRHGGGSAEMAKQSEHGGEQLKAVETIRRKGAKRGRTIPARATQARNTRMPRPRRRRRAGRIITPAKPRAARGASIRART